MKKITTLITTCFLIYSCSSYVNKIHRDIDSQYAKKRQEGQIHQVFSDYKKRRITTQNQKYLLPRVKKQYLPPKARYKTDDLTEDSSDSGSIWAGSGNENYLFTKNRWKRHGDIVLINVQSKLKREITSELKRSFPPPQSRGKKKKNTASPEKKEISEKEKKKEDVIYDKISGIIIEEISKNHLLIRGKKNLLFGNRKHLVELQALIARKDILDDDTINSNKILESSIKIIR